MRTVGLAWPSLFPLTSVLLKLVLVVGLLRLVLCAFARAVRLDNAVNYCWDGAHSQWLQPPGMLGRELAHQRGPYERPQVRHARHFARVAWLTAGQGARTVQRPRVLWCVLPLVGYTSPCRHED